MGFTEIKQIKLICLPFYVYCADVVSKLLFTIHFLDGPGWWQMQLQQSVENLSGWLIKAELETVVKFHNKTAVLVVFTTPEPATDYMKPGHYVRICEKQPTPTPDRPRDPRPLHPHTHNDDNPCYPGPAYHCNTIVNNNPGPAPGA